MFGRRRHTRFALPSRPEGVLRIMRDVAIERTIGADEVTAISRESGVVGETLTVEIPGESAGLAMEVVESRPMIVSGAVRHRLRMRRAQSSNGPAAIG